MPSTVRPGAPAWSRGGRSLTPVAVGTTFHDPGATRPATLPLESSTRKGPEAETTVSGAGGAGFAATGGAGFPGAGGAGFPDAGGAGVPSGGPAGRPLATATRTVAGSLAAGTLTGWIPP